MPVLVKPGPLRRTSHSDPRGGAESLTGILTGTRFFRLRKPIRVREREENGLWVQECKPLRISAFGETRSEAWQAFIELFECDWDSLAHERDSRLTADAQQIKRKLLELVESVETVL